jgi:5-methylcytosine-specific restriction endonuclease McrA
MTSESRLHPTGSLAMDYAARHLRADSNDTDLSGASPRYLTGDQSMITTQASETAFVDRFEAVVDLVLERRSDEAAERLSAISQVGSSVDHPQPPPLARQAAVFARDHYSCRYCGTRTVLIPVMYAMSALYGRIFKAHRQWRRAETDVAYWTYATSLEHVVPSLHGGTNDFENLATACWRCNALKGNATLEQLGWALRSVSDQPWDGLGSRLPGLLAVMEASPYLEGLMKTTRAYFEGWIGAIKEPEPLA